jgi:hypothetical protein
MRNEADRLLSYVRPVRAALLLPLALMEIVGINAAADQATFIASASAFRASTMTR